MSEVNKRFFDALLESRDMSLRELARRMGMGHGQLSLTFSGARRMQLDEAVQIAQIFGQPIQTIIENMGVTVGTQRVAVVGALTGEGTVETLGDPAPRTTAPDSAPEGAIAINCRTAETPLAWMDGWMMFCADPASGSGGFAALAGRFCYAQITDGQRVCATIRRGYGNGWFNLSGPYRAQDVSLDWATPILVTRH